MSALPGDPNLRLARLRVVLLEDSSFDAGLVRTCLLAAYPNTELDVVHTEDEFVERLVRDPVEVILCDYRLPGFTGANALEVALAAAPNVPFIMVSGLIGEENAVEMMKLGATDYVSKSRLSRLPVVIERALREVADRRARGFAESRLVRADAQLARAEPALSDHAFFLLDTHGLIQMSNAAAHALLASTPTAPGWAHLSAGVLLTASDPNDEAHAVGSASSAGSGHAGSGGSSSGTAGSDLLCRDALTHGQSSGARWIGAAGGARFWGEYLLIPLFDSAGLHSGFSLIVRKASGAPAA